MVNNSQADIPRHIGIIPDGNRTWSRECSISFREGYDIGIKKAEEVVGYLENPPLKGVTDILTLYVFSLENFQRRKRAECDYLFHKFAKTFEAKLGDERIFKNGVRISIIGAKEVLPSYLQHSIEKLEEATRNHSRIFVNLALAYNPWLELLKRKDLLPDYSVSLEMLLSGKPVDDELLNKISPLRFTPQPRIDLVIRTKNRMSLSNFFPPESGYAELYVTKKRWPDFTLDDLMLAVKDYQGRDRKHGG